MQNTVFASLVLLMGIGSLLLKKKPVNLAPPFNLVKNQFMFSFV